MRILYVLLIDSCAKYCGALLAAGSGEPPSEPTEPKPHPGIDASQETEKRRLADLLPNRIKRENELAELSGRRLILNRPVISQPPQLTDLCPIRCTGLE
jgi:hypothetical protein